MSTTTVCIESARLRAIATPDGRVRFPVIVYVRGDETPIATDSINLTASKEREHFLGTVPDEHRDEAGPLLVRLAAEAAAASAKEKRATPPDHNTLDPEVWPAPVDGDQLLTDLSVWMRQYLYVPQEVADAIAAWSVLTWCVESLTFAPLLVVSSASKRCGKTLLLEVLEHIARRGRLTSANGITTAVLFRLNERDHPTLCIDEAEKLQGRDCDRELVQMINSGYRRGAKVLRCGERAGERVIEEFDAFGFRALALIGRPWDTIADRGVIVPMERKPKSALVARFVQKDVDAAGRDFASRTRRWTEDHLEAVLDALTEVDRPLWLSDRDCDNWSGLFAVAAIAGGEWPVRVEAAARQLAGNREDDGDEGERLVHDLRAVFDAQGNPDVLQSGLLCTWLNAIETSPWGEKRNGQGLSPHDLARRLKPFDIQPGQRRNPQTSEHEPVRGYWLADLRPVFERYPAAAGTTVPVVPLHARGIDALSEDEDDEEDEAMYERATAVGA